MTLSRSLRSLIIAGAIVVFSLALAVLVAPAASADLSEEPIVATGPSGAEPLMLASTGLDITVPVIVGLSALLLGTVMIGWAFLATGRRGQHR